MSDIQRTLPQPTQITEGYWQAANEGRLAVQCCQDCGKHQFPPRPFCLSCESDKVDWRDVSGEGVIYTYTINYRSSDAYLKKRLPYAVVVVNLDEGVRMMANLFNADPSEIAIGKRVRVVFERASETIQLPQFELVKP